MKEMINKIMGKGLEKNEDPELTERDVLGYLIGQNFGGQKCRKFGFVPKILSAEKFCLPKILSAEKLYFNCIRW